MVNFFMLLLAYLSLGLQPLEDKKIPAHIFILDFFRHFDKNLIIMFLNGKCKVNFLGVVMIPHVYSEFSNENVEFAHLSFGLGELLFEKHVLVVGEELACLGG